MLEIDGENLTLTQVREVARNEVEVRLSDAAVQKINRSRGTVEAILKTGAPVYGLNTGFGIFAERRIAGTELVRLNRNLILSHATGTGSWLGRDVVRAAMLIRANTLAKGYSGMRLVVIQTILDMLNRGVTPRIPSQGSLGSSGDLGPLAYLGLVLSTGLGDLDEESGWAEFAGKVTTGKGAMAAAGLDRIILEPKEGLALNNGATFSAAIGALAISDADNLVTTGDTAAALSLEALLGCSAAFDERIQAVRGHPGQIASAARIRGLIRSSTLVDAAKRVQDPYSLRCAPQVHGAVRETLEFVRQVLAREINAATDNPLIFPEGEALSGGNFHGEPVGMAMDYLAIAVSELAAISERRIFLLTDARMNAGLPPMLVDEAEKAGLNSGLMMPQYTAASLVLENRTLATPDSVNSLPTSAGQEDHNANSMTAARHAAQVIDNATHVLAVECFAACRAITIRLRKSPGYRLGEGTQPIFERIAAEVPFVGEDHWWNPEIERVKQLLINGDLVS